MCIRCLVAKNTKEKKRKWNSRSFVNCCRLFSENKNLLSLQSEAFLCFLGNKVLIWFCNVSTIFFWLLRKTHYWKIRENKENFEFNDLCCCFVFNYWEYSTLYNKRDIGFLLFTFWFFIPTSFILKTFFLLSFYILKSHWVLI